MKQWIYFAAAMLLCTKPSLSFSEPQTASFLLINPSARAFALGGTNQAFVRGSEAVYSNPANLALMDQKFELSTSLAALGGEQKFGHASFAMRQQNASKIDGYGLFYSQLDEGDQDQRDSSGAKIGSFNSTQRAYGFGAAMPVTKQIRAGVMIKAVESEIAGVRSNRAWAADVGITNTLFVAERSVSVGFLASNWGQKLKLKDEQDSLPRTVAGTFSVAKGFLASIFSLSYSVPQNSYEFNSGLELYSGPVSYRIGYRTDNHPGSAELMHETGFEDTLQHFSYGIGFESGSFKLDYGASQSIRELGFFHRLTLTFLWGPATTGLVQWRPKR